MALPWLGYIPLPGLHAIAVWMAPDDPLTRFHSRQAAVLVWGLYVWLLVIGLLTGLSEASGYLATMGLLAGFALLAAVVGIAVGIGSAATGRYHRLRPIWDVLSARS